eukprot:scaffold306512_cov35-Tisochrysis_lutea.AAC.5
MDEPTWLNMCVSTPGSHRSKLARAGTPHTQTTCHVAVGRGGQIRHIAIWIWSRGSTLEVQLEELAYRWCVALVLVARPASSSSIGHREIREMGGTEGGARGGFIL